MVKQILTHKTTVLLLLGLLLMLPMQWILDLNQERQAYRRQAIEKIMGSASGPQRLIGPVLVQPFVREVTLHDGKEVKRYQERLLRYRLPQRLDAHIGMEVTPRTLGIYQAQVYQAKVTLSGTLDADPDWQVPADAVAETPYLSLALSDARGISQIPTLTLGGKSLEVMPGARLGQLAGVHAPLTTDAGGRFEVALTLQGMERLALVPVGRDSSLTLAGNWPHPNFLGDFLPTSREVTQEGFNARWQTSWFATDMESRLPDLIEEHSDTLPAFATSLVQPVDHYQQNERSAKYALLFIGLTFLAVVMGELLRGLRIHPIQYALVGMSLVIFYLVLLALTEQIGFTPAYLLASLACVLLNAVYLSQALGGPRAGLAFAGLQALLYTVLYGLLQAEDLALLLGALLLLLILALVMMLTRTFDWYALNRRE